MSVPLAPQPTRPGYVGSSGHTNTAIMPKCACHWAHHMTAIRPLTIITA